MEAGGAVDEAEGGNGLVLNDCSCGDDVLSAMGCLGLNSSSSSEPLGLKSSSKNVKNTLLTPSD